MGLPWPTQILHGEEISVAGNRQEFQGVISMAIMARGVHELDCALESTLGAKGRRGPPSAKEPGRGPGACR